MVGMYAFGNGMPPMLASASLKQCACVDGVPGHVSSVAGLSATGVSRFMTTNTQVCVPLYAAPLTSQLDFAHTVVYSVLVTCVHQEIVYGEPFPRCFSCVHVYIPNDVPRLCVCHPITVRYCSTACCRT